MPQGADILVRLFRAVSKAELDDVASFGGFRQHPDGSSYEGKLFATRIEDAAAFGRLNYRLDASIGRDHPFHVLETQVPRALVAQFEVHTLDAMRAVYVSEDLLPRLNRHSIISEIIAIPYETA